MTESSDLTIAAFSRCSCACSQNPCALLARTSALLMLSPPSLLLRHRNQHVPQRLWFPGFLHRLPCGPDGLARQGSLREPRLRGTGAWDGVEHSDRCLLVV